MEKSSRVARSVVVCFTVSVPLLSGPGGLSWQAADAAPARRPVRAGPAGKTNVSSPAFQAYLAGIRNKVTRNWVLADGKNHVVLTTSIGADGTTEDLVVNGTPKNALAEQAASDAFAKSLPLPALPQGINAPAKLTLTFESTADPHGESRSNLFTTLAPAPAAKKVPPTAADSRN